MRAPIAIAAPTDDAINEFAFEMQRPLERHLKQKPSRSPRSLLEIINSHFGKNGKVAPTVAFLTRVVTGLRLSEPNLVKAGVITIGGLVLSHKVPELIKITKYKPKLVVAVVNNLIWNGIWRPRGMSLNWHDKTLLTPIADIMVGGGMLRRLTIDGVYKYLPKLSKPDPIGTGTATPSVWGVANRLARQLKIDPVPAAVIAHFGCFGIKFPEATGQGLIEHWVCRAKPAPAFAKDLVLQWLGMYSIWESTVSRLETP